jgi:hypothetical protein
MVHYDLVVRMPVMQWPSSPQEVQLSSGEIAALVGDALTTFVLRRGAILAALPPPSLISTPTRSSNDLVYVLFENIDDNTQRRYTITVQEEDEVSWRMIVRAEPPIAGRILMSIGQGNNFVARFNPAGEARFESLPAELIFDPVEPNLDFAVLP